MPSVTGLYSPVATCVNLKPSNWYVLCSCSNLPETKSQSTPKKKKPRRLAHPTISRQESPAAREHKHQIFEVPLHTHFANGCNTSKVQIQLRHCFKILKTLSKPEAKLSTLDHSCATYNCERQHKGVNPYQLFTYAENTKKEFLWFQSHQLWALHPEAYLASNTTIWPSQLLIPKN